MQSICGSYLAGVEAVQELCESEQLPAVEIRGAEDLFELRVQQRTAVSQVHDLRTQGDGLVS